MNFNEFQQECNRTANPNINWEQANLNWALGIAGEAGEYCELIKKHTFHGKKPLDLNSLGCSSPPPLFLITEKYFGSGVKKTLKI